jgi:hypothetical protein
MQTAMACAHFAAGRYAEAISWGEKAMRERPNFILPACAVATSAALIGRLDEARRIVARMRRLAPALRLSNIKHLIVLCRAEDHARWERGLREAGLPE